jgi:hypothetical protein
MNSYQDTKCASDQLPRFSKLAMLKNLKERAKKQMEILNRPKSNGFNQINENQK